MITGKKQKTALSQENHKFLDRMFKTEEDYREKMQALWKTRKGLMVITEKNPQLKENIMPQLHAINDLIGALYNSDLPHPIYEECSERPFQIEPELLE